MIFTVKDKGSRSRWLIRAGRRSISRARCRISILTSTHSGRWRRLPRRRRYVFMSNHSEFDGAVSKIKMLAGRKAGEPHPFEVGADAVARYFKVSEECADVARLKLK